MVEPVRHRQTKGAATDMFDLQPPRHTSTLPSTAVQLAPRVPQCGWKPDLRLLLHRWLISRLEIAAVLS